jgi:hypothetical protein
VRSASRLGRTLNPKAQHHRSRTLRDIPVSFNNNNKGRGVPDIAGDAAPSTGYRIVVGGQAGPVGGTSAVAPLWAGLFALINEVCARPAGLPHPLLYGNPAVCRDIISGDNKNGNIGYEAPPGLGSLYRPRLPERGKAAPAIPASQRQHPVATRAGLRASRPIHPQFNVDLNYWHSGAKT